MLIESIPQKAELTINTTSRLSPDKIIVGLTVKIHTLEGRPVPEWNFTVNADRGEVVIKGSTNNEGVCEIQAIVDVTEGTQRQFFLVLDEATATDWKKVPPTREVTAAERQAEEETILLEKLKAAFNNSIAIWERAGLFTQERTKRGFVKPDFERDYRPLITPQVLLMMKEGRGLYNGYTVPVWVPMDVPVKDDSHKIRNLAAEDELYSGVAQKRLNYYSLLKAAFLRGYQGTMGGKQANTLLVGPKKRVVFSAEIDINNILFVGDWRIIYSGLVYYLPESDTSIKENISVEALLEKLSGVERKTGGILRLERDQLVMPKDVQKKAMSGRDWAELLTAGQTLTAQASAQNITAQNLKQALGFTIYCLETQGWLPDLRDDDDLNKSSIVFAPETYKTSVYTTDKSQLEKPVLYWDIRCRHFEIIWYEDGEKYTRTGVRPGIRII